MTTRVRSSRTAVVLTFLLAASVLIGAPSHAAGPQPLFTSAGEDRGAYPGALRSRTAEITDALSGDRPVRVELPFFDDARVTAVLHPKTVGSTTVWSQGNERSHGRSIAFVFSEGSVSGSAHLPGIGSFSVSGGQGGTVLISQADPHYKATEPPIVPAPALDGDEFPTTVSESPQARSGSGPVIDVMFLITDDVIEDSPYFREDRGNMSSPILTGEALRNEMRLWGEDRVATLNEGFANTGVNVSTRLVYSGSVEYSETGSSVTDLDHLTFIKGQDCEGAPGVQECDPQGRLDEVRSLRDDFGADVVFLITYYGDSGGIAWLQCAPNTGQALPNANGPCSPHFGYSVVDFAAGTLGLTVGHELGHLLGGRHDRYNGGFTYARGHLEIGEFGTLLAYYCDPSDCEGTFTDNRINNYSNPSVLVGGSPTGVVIGDSDEANMGAHIPLSAPRVEDFRNPLTCRGKPVTIFGSPFADTIAGTSGNDVIRAFGGNDRIQAGDGNDYVCAGSGNDKVWGGGGKDRIWGESGNDLLVGDAKRDRLYGNGGDDKIKGKGGRDTLVGGSGTDDLNGGGNSNDFCKSGETYASCENIG